jgi:hypothetical protein
LLHGGLNLGTIVLGPDPAVPVFSDDDLDLIEDIADRVAGVVHTASLQKATVLHIETMARQFRHQEAELQAQMRAVLRKEATKPIAAGWDEAEFNELVEDALRHIGDYSYLGQHKLASLEVVSALVDCVEYDQVTHLDRGRALHKLLTTCIDKLNPSGSRPDPPTREWRAYVILQDCYVEGMRNRDVMNLLYISEATFHRARRRAVKAVARAVGDMERRVHLPKSHSIDSI